jgi:hypothetical protein
METRCILQKRRPSTAESMWYGLQARPKHEHVAVIPKHGVEDLARGMPARAALLGNLGGVKGHQSSFLIGNITGVGPSRTSRIAHVSSSQTRV